MRCLYRSILTIAVLFISLPSWAVGPPCSCVRDMLQDRPSPYPDVYSCIDYTGDTCDDPEPQDDIYVGFPHQALPQQCENGDCEPCIACGGQKVKNDRTKKDREAHKAHWTPSNVEGHQETLTEVNAWGEFCAQLKSAQDFYGSKATLRPGGPRYYILKKSKWPVLANDIKIMVVPLDIPDPLSPNMKPLYFGIELDDAPHAIEWPSVKDITVATGKILVSCKTSNQTYNTFVWLKTGTEGNVR